MNYYCLIAGLPDLQPDDTKTNISIAKLKTELLDVLSASDAQLVKLIFSEYDNENLLAYLANKEARLNPLGNLQTEDWKQLFALMLEVEKPKDSRLLSYFHTFFRAYNNNELLEAEISPEDHLAGLYYQFAMQNKNAFLAKWFEFNLNINNILTAITCRKHGFNLQKMVVGDNEIANTIRQSNARDFGLTGLFEDLDSVMQLAEEKDLLEREKKIDLLKWKWLHDNTFFNYFSVEIVLAYLLKIEMIDRWTKLTTESGTHVFRQLLHTLKEGGVATIPQSTNR